MKTIDLKQKKQISSSRKRTKASQSQEIATLDENGMYPIHSAIQDSDLGLLEHLINSGANINKYNKDKDTPLLLAVKEGNYQMVEKLLEEGADLYKLDANQQSPIEVAINLDYQECIDILTEHEALHKKGTKNERRDDSLEFVTALIRLLHDEIGNATNPRKAGTLSGQVLVLLRQYLHLGGVSEEILGKLNTDITHRITQFTSFLTNNAKILNKDILNLARKIIGIIQDCRRSLPANVEWTLSKIESLIEEKIVLSRADSQKTESHIFVQNNAVKQDTVRLKTVDEDWYTRNGYKDFDEFIRVNSSSASNVQFLKFSNITKEKILQKTNCRSTEKLELITIRPLKLGTKEEFSLLIPDALKRIKEEESLFNQLDLQAYSAVLDKAKNGESLSSDEEIQLDKVLRPGKQNKMHIIHFHHTTRYESFWHDLTKEAFFTGATMHLFNPPANATRPDFIYSGMAIINKLLDEDVHPDKIILQSYGDGYVISNEVKNQFYKRGIELTQVNYQHSSFSPTSYPDFICDHRHLHICEQKAHRLNVPNKENNPQEFSIFAKHIARNLAKIKCDEKTPYITAASSEDYSATQLINSFITASQRFLKNYINYKNPALPDERVESILGVAGL